MQERPDQQYGCCGPRACGGGGRDKRYSMFHVAVLLSNRSLGTWTKNVCPALIRDANDVDLVKYHLHKFFDSVQEIANGPPLAVEREAIRDRRRL